MYMRYPLFLLQTHGLLRALLLRPLPHQQRHVLLGELVGHRASDLTKFVLQCENDGGLGVVRGLSDFADVVFLLHASTPVCFHSPGLNVSSLHSCALPPFRLRPPQVPKIILMTLFWVMSLGYYMYEKTSEISDATVRWVWNVGGACSYFNRRAPALEWVGIRKFASLRCTYLWPALRLQLLVEL